MMVELDVRDDFCDRVIVASLSDALYRAKKRQDNDSKKYAKALLTVLYWYMPPSDFVKLKLEP